MIEDNLRDYLLTKVAITTLVSTRIYPEYLPQKPTLPAITFARTSSPRIMTLNTGRPGLAAARIQIDCWAKTYGAAKALGEQVRIALQGYTGTLSGTVSAQAVHFYGDWDVYEPETKEHRVVMDFEIWHAES